MARKKRYQQSFVDTKEQPTEAQEDVFMTMKQAKLVRHNGVYLGNMPKDQFNKSLKELGIKIKD